MPAAATTPAETTATYDAIAAAYHARWANRTVMAPALARFVALVAAQTLPSPWVADLGCGPGFDAAALRGAGVRAVGGDLSLGMLRDGLARYAVPLFLGDMGALPLCTGAAGLWVNASLHHLPREQVPAALCGFARVLRPGGVLFLSLKGGTGSAWQETAGGTAAAGDPARRRFFTFWTLDALVPLLEAAGLALIESTTAERGTTTWLALFARRGAE